MTQMKDTNASTSPFSPKVYLAVHNKANPGPTSWTAVWLDNVGKLCQVNGIEPNCSNMRAELIAATAALKQFPSKTPINVICQSQYLLNYHQNLPGWKQRDWRTSTGKQVSNSDEWLELDKLACRRKVTFTTTDADPRSLASYARQLAVAGLSLEQV